MFLYRFLGEKYVYWWVMLLLFIEGNYGRLKRLRKLFFELGYEVKSSFVRKDWKIILKIKD